MLKQTVMIIIITSSKLHWTGSDTESDVHQAGSATIGCTGPSASRIRHKFKCQWFYCQVCYTRFNRYTGTSTGRLRCDYR